MPTVKRLKQQPPPRERILQAARELFYRDGINAVSVDAIASAAGTNKMTLYRQFASKDALISAYLGELAAEGEAIWEEARGAHPGDPQAQLRYLMRRVSQFAADSPPRLRSRQRRDRARRAQAPGAQGGGRTNGSSARA
jgi:AcrR family transcriptional regulator